LLGQVLSASQFKEYYSCNRKWAYSKVEDIPIEPNVNMEIGNLVHEAIELFNKNHDPLGQYRSGSSSTSQKMVNHIKNIAKKKVFKNRNFNGLKSKLQSDDNTVYILELLEYYAKTIYSEFKRLKNHDYYYESDTTCFDKAFPDLSEMKLTVEDDGSWFATSTIDAVYKNHPLFSYDTAIIDYKTSSSNNKSFANISSGHELQLKFYAWMYYQVFDVVPDLVGIHFVGTNPDENYPIYLKDIAFHDIISTHDLICDMKDNVGSDDIDDYKRNEEYQWCGEDYCDHYDYCIGDEDIPEDHNSITFEGPDRDNTFGELKEPTFDDMTYASNSDE
jgi:hypothetical protein